MFDSNGFSKVEAKFEFNLMNFPRHVTKSVQLGIVIKSTHIAGSDTGNFMKQGTLSERTQKVSFHVTVRDALTKASFKNPNPAPARHCLPSLETKTILTFLSFRRCLNGIFPNGGARSLLEDMKAIIVGGAVKKITF